ncbi:hypothetical protein SAMN05216360_103353 [Methylobacterium phyllostachyos]|uniref:Uncharacterized protein n=1 Tax=Methylobacterium phyllostachyos TaxID=582672 RepID=A0A1G9W0C4_9HYPH|nr:hypothetical protein SAMN05216360_103353 [Methylobacterium phyllostachyos]
MRMTAPPPAIACPARSGRYSDEAIRRDEWTSAARGQRGFLAGPFDARGSGGTSAITVVTFL